jgi:hypothetical protein
VLDISKTNGFDRVLRRTSESDADLTVSVARELGGRLA